MTLQKPKYFLSCPVQKSLPTRILKHQIQSWCFISYSLITQNSSIGADKHWVGQKVRSDFSMCCYGKARWTFWPIQQLLREPHWVPPGCSGLLPRSPPQLPQTSGNIAGVSFLLVKFCLSPRPSPGGPPPLLEGRLVKVMVNQWTICALLMLFQEQLFANLEELKERSSSSHVMCFPRHFLRSSLLIYTGSLRSGRAWVLPSGWPAFHGLSW